MAYHLDDAPWPATKEELIDYAIRSCAPLEVVENLEELEDELYRRMARLSHNGRFSVERGGVLRL